MKRSSWNRKQKKRDWKNLLKLEKNLSKLKKYSDYDDFEYKAIREVKNLFDLSIYEYYYKPIKTNDAFNSNYGSKGDKAKLYQLKKILIWSNHF